MAQRFYSSKKGNKTMANQLQSKFSLQQKNKNKIKNE